MTENMLDVKTIILLKQYAKGLVSNAVGGVKDGKSAYEIAKDHGFVGTEEEWINSLQADVPSIGENGNWYIGDVDTGVQANIKCPDTVSAFLNDAGYLTENDIINDEPIPADQIKSLFK